MSIRLSIYQAAEKYHLDGKALQRFFAVAGLSSAPEHLQQNFWKIVSIFAAALGGFGIILWVAANWDSLSRTMQFGLLQGFIGLMCLGAWLKPSIAKPLCLLAVLGIGALFAYFGQTYQTGADPWQLFTLWAILALPICFAMRSDVLWLPWAAIAFTAIKLWSYSRNYHWQHADYFADWLLMIVVSAGLSPLLRRFTGAGDWAFRFSLWITIGVITSDALDAIYSYNQITHVSSMGVAFWAGLALLSATAAWFSQRRWFDLYVLSMVAFALNTLIFWFLFDQIFFKNFSIFSSNHSQDSWFGRLILMGLIGVTMLTVSVKWILKLANRDREAGAHYE